MKGAGLARAGRAARLRDRLLVVGALLLALSAAVYWTQVLRPAVAQLAQQSGFAQGNLSDLYSRWYGSRELLRRGGDPYGAAMTAAMQIGFYGRAAGPGETLHEAAIYAQPVYTAFLLAPLTLLDFAPVQLWATALFPVLIAGGALLWAAVLQRGLRFAQRLMIVVLALAAPPTLEAARVQQLSAPVFLLVAASVYLVTRRRYIPAGILLALSTIKPQESWAVIAVLGVWAAADWQARRRLPLSFAATLLVLEAGAEWLLPGWLFRFVPALARYNALAVDGQVFLHFLPWGLLAAFAAGWLALLGWAAARARHDAPDSPRLAVTLVFALAVAQVTLVTHLLYESIYLIPGLLALVWTRDAFRAHPPVRLFGGLVLAALLWPWVTVAVLGGAEAAGWGIDRAGPILQFLPWQIDSVLPTLCAAALVFAVRAAPSAARPSPRAVSRDRTPERTQRLPIPL